MTFSAIGWAIDGFRDAIGSALRLLVDRERGRKILLPAGIYGLCSLCFFSGTLVAGPLPPGRVQANVSFYRYGGDPVSDITVTYKNSDLPPGCQVELTGWSTRTRPGHHFESTSGIQVAGAPGPDGRFQFRLRGLFGSDQADGYREHDVGFLFRIVYPDHGTAFDTGSHSRYDREYGHDQYGFYTVLIPWDSQHSGNVPVYSESHFDNNRVLSAHYPKGEVRHYWQETAGRRSYTAPALRVCPFPEL